jgi:branched-chain amino acid transport system permease protein
MIRHGSRSPAARLRPTGPGVLIALAAAGVVLWSSGHGFRQDLVVLGGTYALLALGMYVPFILGDRLSLAYNAYLGIGAYAIGLMGTRTGVPMLWAVPVGMAVAATLAVVLGFATRKLSGFYLAAVTLLFGFAFETWLVDSTETTGGSAGIGGIPGLSLFGADVSRADFVIAEVVLVCIVATLLARLRGSAFGITVRAQREADVAVEAMGVRVPTLVLVASALGAAIAALAGSMFALVNHAVLPETFTLNIVLLALFMPLLGGQVTPWGAVLGAAIVTYLTFGLDLFESTGTLMFALAVLVLMIVAPQGILGLVQQLLGRLGLTSRRTR